MHQPGNHEMDTQVSLVACVRLIVLGSLMWSLTATSVLSTHAVAEDTDTYGDRRERLGIDHSL